MKKIHMGFSRKLDHRELMRLLDVDPDHPDGVSRFRRAFGTGYIDPGSYEIYRRVDAGGEFGRAALQALTPFELPDLSLFDFDLSDATIVFFVRDENEWSAEEALGVKITDTFLIDKFDFE